MYQEPCDTSAESYKRFAEAAVHQIPTDKVVVWS